MYYLWLATDSSVAFLSVLVNSKPEIAQFNPQVSSWQNELLFDQLFVGEKNS